MGALRDLADALFGAAARRHKHRPLLEATMATSALIAYADGEVTFSERTQIDRIVEGLDSLKDFDVHEAIDLFTDYTEALRDRPEAAHAKALAAVARIRDDEEAAALIVRIAMAISGADGEVSEPERASLSEICGVLGLPVPASER